MKFVTCFLPLFLICQLTSGNPTYRELMDLADLLDVEKRYSKEDMGEYIRVCQQDPIDLALVIDASRSIDYRDFGKGQKFLVDFVSAYDIGPGKSQVRVCAVTFGRGVYTEDAFNLNTFKTKDQVLEALGNMPFRAGDRTDTGDAIKFMREVQMAKPRDVPKIAIVMTDGNSQKRTYTAEQARLAREENITMFAIGVGPYVAEVELLSISGDPVRAIKADNYDSLEKIKESLAYKTCKEVPKPTTTPPPTTTTMQAQKPCSEEYPSDINFVFSPATLGVDATSWVTQFISHTINSEELENGFQYGVVSGSCPDDGGFALNRYQTTDAIRQHLNRYDRNNLPELVRQAGTTGFTTANGARPSGKASRVAVVFLGKTKVDPEKLRTELRALLDAGVQVFVARTDPGVSPSLPEGVRLLAEGSSISQSAELVEHICHLNERVF